MSTSEQTSRRYELSDRYLADEGTVFLTGTQALARLPLEQLRADRLAGLRTAALVSGYPGSPLGGYDVTVAAAAALDPELPVQCRPAMNEEFAASAVMGSQLAATQPDCLYDGIVGIWYGKSPGVDRAADALRHAVFAGTSTHGGVVALVGDDPAAKSSTLPSSSAGTLASMHVPVLYPGDPAEALSLGRHAITLSRVTGLWSALKIVADVADANASVQLRPELHDPVIPLIEGAAYAHRPDGRLLTPHTLEIEREIVEVRYELAKRYASDNRLNRVTVDPPEAWLGIVASGITYREVREALARLGLSRDEDVRACGIRLFRMGMPLPFNPATVRDFARGLPCVFVIEEKQPNLESLIKDALYDLRERPVVVGKRDETGAPLVPGHGALDADALVPLLRRRLSPRLGDRLTPPGVDAGAALPRLAVRHSPFFCSGCPHNRSTQVAPGTLVGAGIGCHTMALLMDPERVGEIAGVACMGNEGIAWVGMSDFVGRDHWVQNLGDGTYFHSGQLTVPALVSAGVNVTVKLLYNGAIAMTGGQLPQGQLAVPELARVLLEQGVSEVLVTTDEPESYASEKLPDGVQVWPRQRLVEAQEHLSRVPGVTVLIHDQACAAELRRARKRGRAVTPSQRVVINPRICEGCGHCAEVSNCLSVQPVETEFGRKTRIDQTTCNLDYSCLEGDCPSFMTVDLPERSEVSESRDIPEPAEVWPQPSPIVPEDEFALRITGIGGTGIVTVAQVLGTAAMLDGYHVRGLDQTGLSQKAGPVVSDLRLSRAHPSYTNRLGREQADLLLACDALVAASERGLLTAHPERTCVVGSSSATPTGEMIQHPELGLPPTAELAQRIAGVTRSDAQFWADAGRITRELLGNAAAANLFVVGMAVQAGCLPISAKHIEEAIELNGVAVAANRAAFHWGRTQVADPAALGSALMRRRSATPSLQVELPAALEARVAALGVGGELSARLRRFAAELRAWGRGADARRWLSLVERTAAAEARVAPGSERLTRSVASQAFKLAAYKDEYEVARLMTHPEGLAELREMAVPGSRLAWQLHPPLLRAMGMQRKLRVPFWTAPFVRLLARGKWLRGTALDPFGRTALRRIERELPGEYAAAIDQALDSLRPDTLDAAVALAALPEEVRGYEEIKMARVERYREKLAGALASLG